MGNEIINHLMYADDLVIMAPSVTGLSKLLRICELFAASHHGRRSVGDGGTRPPPTFQLDGDRIGNVPPHFFA